MSRPVLLILLFLSSFFPSIALADGAFEGTADGVTRSALPIYGGNIEDLAIASDGSLYAAAGSPNGIFCSTDGATTWDSPPSGSDFGSISAVVVGGTAATVFIIGGIDLYRSLDGCATWTGLSSSTGENDFGKSMVFAGSTLLVAFRDGTVEVSSDNGASFTKRTIDASVSTVESLAAGTTTGTFFALAQAGSSTKLFKSTDSGTTWSEVHVFISSPNRLGVSSKDENTIVVASNNAVEISTDAGITFADRTPVGLKNNAIRFVTVSGVDRIFVGSSYTEDGGTTWTDLNDDATTDSELKGHIVVDPSSSMTFYMSSNRGVTKSTDTTATWSDAVTGMLGVQVGGIAQATDKNILLLIGLGGVAKTTNYLADSPTWSYPIRVDSSGTAPTAIFMPDRDSPSTLLAAAMNGIFRSTDTGDTWTAVSTGDVLENRDDVREFAQTTDGTLYAGFTNSDDNSGGVAKSVDGGLTWTEANLTNNPSVNALLAIGNVLYAGVGAENTSAANQRGIYKLQSGSWTQLSGAIDGKKINDLMYDGTKIFASAGDVSDGGLFTSSDLGDTWSDLSSNFAESRCLETLSVNPDDLNEVYVGFGCPAGTFIIYRSTDGGSSWDTFYTGLKDEVPGSMLFDDLIVGLSTGAFEFAEGDSSSFLSSITFLLKKKKSGKKTLKAVAKDADGNKLEGVSFQLQYKKKKKQTFANKGKEKTTNSKGLVSWKAKKKGFYRVVSGSVTSKTKKVKK